MSLSLRELIGELQSSAQEAERRARDELLSQLQDAASSRVNELPGSPSFLSLLPETQLAPERLTIELPLWVNLDDMATAGEAGEDEGSKSELANLRVQLQPMSANVAEGKLVFHWEQKQTSELALKLRDDEIRRLTFEIQPDTGKD